MTTPNLPPVWLSSPLRQEGSWLDQPSVLPGEYMNWPVPESEHRKAAAGRVMSSAREKSQADELAQAKQRADMYREHWGNMITQRDDALARIAKLEKKLKKAKKRVTVVAMLDERPWKPTFHTLCPHGTPVSKMGDTTCKLCTYRKTALQAAAKTILARQSEIRKPLTPEQAQSVEEAMNRLMQCITTTEEVSE